MHPSERGFDDVSSTGQIDDDTGLSEIPSPEKLQDTRRRSVETAGQRGETSTPSVSPPRADTEVTDHHPTPSHQISPSTLNLSTNAWNFSLSSY
jgi:hypothetical protein